MGRANPEAPRQVADQAPGRRRPHGLPATTATGLRRARGARWRASASARRGLRTTTTSGTSRWPRRGASSTASPAATPTGLELRPRGLASLRVKRYGE